MTKTLEDTVTMGYIKSYKTAPLIFKDKIVHKIAQDHVTRCNGKWSLVFLFLKILKVFSVKRLYRMVKYIWLKKYRETDVMVSGNIKQKKNGKKEIYIYW